METAQLEEIVYAALSGDEKLGGLLIKGKQAVFHLQAPSVYPDYPILVYTVISDVPALHADNYEKLHRVTIRIHIITSDGENKEIYEAVKRIMYELGFTRLQTTPLMEGGKKMLVADFRKVIGG